MMRPTDTSTAEARSMSYSLKGPSVPSAPGIVHVG